MPPPSPDAEPTLSIAILTTAHFEFIAGGRSSAHALVTLERAWDTHTRQTGATAAWDDLVDEVTVLTLRAGEAVRDKCPITLAARPAAD
jgi:hypothetical protein